MPIHKLINQITDFTCNGSCSNCGECYSNFCHIRPEICRSFICSKSITDIEESKRLCYESKRAINMWHEMFGVGE